MSYFACPDCGKRHSIYGESHIEQTAAAHGIEVLGKLPMDPSVAKAADTGTIELFVGDWLDHAADRIEQKLKKD